MNNNVDYFCVVIDCAINRSIKYDNDQNIIYAVVDYCFDNQEQLRLFLGARWFKGEFFDDTTPKDKIDEKNNHLDEIVNKMNNNPNKLIRSDKLSGNDSCCHYMIFKTKDVTKIKSYSRYIECNRDGELMEKYNVNDYNKVIESTISMLERQRKWSRQNFPSNEVIEAMKIQTLKRSAWLNQQSKSD